MCGIRSWAESSRSWANSSRSRIRIRTASRTASNSGACSQSRSGRTAGTAGTVHSRNNRGTNTHRRTGSPSTDRNTGSRTTGPPRHKRRRRKSHSRPCRIPKTRRTCSRSIARRRGAPARRTRAQSSERFGWPFARYPPWKVPLLCLAGSVPRHRLDSKVGGWPSSHESETLAGPQCHHPRTAMALLLDTRAAGQSRCRRRSGSANMDRYESQVVIPNRTGE